EAYMNESAASVTCDQVASHNQRVAEGCIAVCRALGVGVRKGRCYVWVVKHIASRSVEVVVILDRLAPGGAGRALPGIEREQILIKTLEGGLTARVREAGQPARRDEPSGTGGAAVGDCKRRHHAIEESIARNWITD